MFGDAAAEDPNLDIFSLINGRDLKLKKQTISESHLINCHINSAKFIDTVFPSDHKRLQLMAVRFCG